MKKPLKISIICFVISIIFVVLYNLNGSYVDADGILRESFAFIPLAYFFACTGLAFLVVSFFSYMKKK